MYFWILTISLIVGQQILSLPKTPKLFNVYQSDGSRYAIKIITTPTIITCVTACYQNGRCNGVTAEKNCSNIFGKPCNISCTFLSNYDYNSSASLRTTSALTYFSNDCTDRELDQCNPNPCQNSGNCVRQTGIGCWSRPYVCQCQERFAGKWCESCADNRTGLHCEVDTTGTILIDGTYFYVHGAVHNGTDLEPGLRPTCTVSRAACLARNMTLLTIKDAAKNATVASLNLHSSNCHSCFYQIGVVPSAAENGSWVWEEDGSPVNDFQQWYPGQPDKVPGSTGRAVFMPANYYAWSDVSCEFPAYYICEYSIPV